MTSAPHSPTSYHSFAISKSGAVFGWGKNVFGQLGVSDSGDRWYPTLVKALRLQKVKSIACGEDHTVVLTSEGGVFTFGHGQFGQLGMKRRKVGLGRIWLWTYGLHLFECKNDTFALLAYNKVTIPQTTKSTQRKCSN